MKIRSFALADYRKVRNLWVSSGLEIRPGDEPEGIARKLSRDGELFLVAEEDGAIVGTVMGAFDGRRGWIYHLGVRREFRRRGVAMNLIKELEGRMKRIGVPKVNAMIYPWNDSSMDFFASAGYIIEDMKEAQKWLIDERADANGSSSPRAGQRRSRRHSEF
jgi:ribosomal protein S18 acetylase RimI-like enzyme